MYRPLFEADPQIAAAIDNETRRQHEGLELIASENFVSEAVPRSCRWFGLQRTSMRKAIQGSAITAVASSLTWLRNQRTRAKQLLPRSS
jgi:hypothetical protein